jgi:hypothetical protein
VSATPLTDKEQAAIHTALDNIDKLDNAFRFIVDIKRAADTHVMTEADFNDIEQIIDQPRKDSFWIKHQLNANELLADDNVRAPDGFFREHVRKSTLKYKTAEYEDHLDVLSKWVHDMRMRADRGFAAKINTANARKALSTIQRNLWADGGRHALKVMSMDDRSDRSYAAGRVAEHVLIHKQHELKRELQPDEKVRLRQEIPEGHIAAYIHQNNEHVTAELERIRELPENKGRGPDVLPDGQLLNDYNEARVNRRKDLLDALVAQMGVNIAVIENLHLSQQPAAAAQPGPR